MFSEAESGRQRTQTRQSTENPEREAQVRGATHPASARPRSQPASPLTASVPAHSQHLRSQPASPLTASVPAHSQRRPVCDQPPREYPSADQGPPRDPAPKTNSTPSETRIGLRGCGTRRPSEKSSRAGICVEIAESKRRCGGFHCVRARQGFLGGLELGSANAGAPAACSDILAR